MERASCILRRRNEDMKEKKTFICPYCKKELDSFWERTVSACGVDLTGEPLGDVQPYTIYMCPECDEDITEEVEDYFDSLEGGR